MAVSLNWKTKLLYFRTIMVIIKCVQVFRDYTVSNIAALIVQLFLILDIINIMLQRRKIYLRDSVKASRYTLLSKCFDFQVQ